MRSTLVEYLNRADLVLRAPTSRVPNMPAAAATWGSDSNGAKSHVKGRSWDRLASQDLSPSVSQGTIWRYVAVDRRLGYA